MGRHSQCNCPPQQPHKILKPFSESFQVHRPQLTWVNNRLEETDETHREFGTKGVDRGNRSGDVVVGFLHVFCGAQVELRSRSTEASDSAGRLPSRSHRPGRANWRLARAYHAVGRLLRPFRMSVRYPYRVVALEGRWIRNSSLPTALSSRGAQRRRICSCF